MNGGLTEQEKLDSNMISGEILTWAMAIQKEVNNKYASARYIQEKIDKIRFLLDLIEYKAKRHIEED